MEWTPVIESLFAASCGVVCEFFLKWNQHISAVIVLGSSIPPNGVLVNIQDFNCLLSQKVYPDAR